MRVAMFGGTFNPPHLGHMAAARACVETLGLDLLLLMPANLPPHKALPEGSATPEQRLEAARLRQSTKKDADAARDYRKRLEEERERAMRDARAEAEAIVREAREMSELVFNELNDMKKQAKKTQDFQAVNQQRTEVRRLINETESRTQARRQ